jgi:hypothetical protein
MEKKQFFEDFKKIQDTMETIGRNAEGFKYKYADLPQVWEGIKKVISENNFIVYHQANAEGVDTTALHSSGESLTSFIPFSGSLKPQDRGSEITYYKRYNIQAIFNVMIVGEDDDGKTANDNVQKKLSNSMHTRLSFEDQCDTAKKGELKCLLCASPIEYYETKTGEARLKCTKNWQHKKWISKAEAEIIKKGDKPF